MTPKKFSPKNTRPGVFFYLVNSAPFKGLFFTLSGVEGFAI